MKHFARTVVMNVLVAGILGLLLLGTAARAEDSIAVALAVKPQADTLRDAASTALLPQDRLFEGQTISTGPSGQVQVLFADNTKMVVGPGSTLLIQKILMQNDGTASSFAVKALGGTFRFLSGTSSKQAYKITTPTGSIGVRGTEFDFIVDPVTGETKVILYGGQTIICAGNDDCVTLSEICGIASTSSQSAQVLGSGRGTAGKNGFSYAGNQQPLLQTFRVDGASACAQRVQQTFQSLIDSPPASAPPEQPQQNTQPNTQPGGNGDGIG